MASERINQLARNFEDQRQLAEVYKRAAGGRGPRELIGQSAVHKRLQQEIQLVGNSALSVLITGETGVGKELVAEAIHLQSPRAQKPLISLNCAALPEMLVESELFGHVKGAFSGAVSGRSGKFELADGGTIFLDEVGELPLPVQAKLLRVLQSGQLQRVGSDQEHHVDVRIIAATNRDLADEVRAGRFRADLYHRLSVYPLLVPPLRERGRDVLLLAGFFLEENRARMGLRSLRLNPDAQKMLVAYSWPGNVRELEHLISRATLKALSTHSERPRILTIEAQSLGMDEQVPDEQPVPAGEAKPSTAGYVEGPSDDIDPAATYTFEAEVNGQWFRWVGQRPVIEGDRAKFWLRDGTPIAAPDNLAEREGFEPSIHNGLPL